MTTTHDLREAVERFNFDHAARAEDMFLAASHALRLGVSHEGRELHSACPRCGGENRFVLIARPREGGPPFAWCRQCRKHLGLADLATAADVGRPPAPRDVAVFLKRVGRLDDRPVARRDPRRDSPGTRESVSAIARQLRTVLALSDGPMRPEDAAALLRVDMDALRRATRELLRTGDVVVAETEGEPVIRRRSATATEEPRN